MTHYDYILRSLITFVNKYFMYNIKSLVLFV